MSNRETHDLAMTSSAPAKHFLAHVRRKEDGSFEMHHLEEHLRAVADLADGKLDHEAHFDLTRESVAGTR